MSTTGTGRPERRRAVRRCATGAVVLALGLVLSSCDLVPQATFVVTTTADAVDAEPGDGVCETTVGAGDCSLRAAIQEANEFHGDTTITLGAGATYVLSLAGTDEAAAATGDLDIASSVVIDGADAVVDADGHDRAFDVASGAALHLDHLTVTGGVAAYGGGIANAGTTSISNSTITGNEANGFATCDQSFFDITCDGGRGGGGGIDTSGSLNMWSSTVEANWAHSAACDIVPHLTHCYVQAGAGLNVSGTATLVNVTISGNRQTNGDGAAIAATGAATVLYSTLADNVTDITSSTGFVNQVFSGNTLDGNIELGASVVDNPDVVDDPNIIYHSICKVWSLFDDGTVLTSLGYNVFGDRSCLAETVLPSDRHELDGGLSLLGNHGGPTRTHLPGAPLIDQVPASDLLCAALPDQRGGTRPVSGSCDIGSVEVGADGSPA